MIEGQFLRLRRQLEATLRSVMTYRTVLNWRLDCVNPYMCILGEKWYNCQCRRRKEAAGL